METNYNLTLDINEGETLITITNYSESLEQQINKEGENIIYSVLRAYYTNDFSLTTLLKYFQQPNSIHKIDIYDEDKQLIFSSTNYDKINSTYAEYNKEEPTRSRLINFQTDEIK